MKVVKRTNDLLILRGHGWARLVGALLCFLLTPLWVWMAWSADEPKIAIGVAIFPAVLLAWVYNTFQNWQLVLEANYNRGGLYRGKWLTRQIAQEFDLNDLQDAYVQERVSEYRDRYFRTRSETENTLVLRRIGSRRPYVISLGNRSNTHGLAAQINSWLETYAIKSGIKSGTRERQPKGFCAPAHTL